MLRWTEITILAALFFSFALGAWMLRRQPKRYIWLWAWCALIATGVALQLVERLPFLVPGIICVSSLFPVLLLAGSMETAGREIPRWLLPAGLALGLTRAALYMADLEVGTSLLALASEPAMAATAALVYHRHTVRQGAPPVGRLIAVGLLLVAIVEGWDALGDLLLGPASSPSIAWILVATPLAALLIIESIQEAWRTEARATSALRDSERRFRGLAEHTDDVITEVGADGHLIFVSPNLRSAMGYEPEEFLGLHSIELTERVGVSPHEEIPGMSRVADLGAAGAFDRTWRVRRKDGSWRWFEIHATTYEAQDGELRAIAVSRDVTERVEAEQKRRDLEAQMQETRRLESVGMLAGGIAHDFNNLLVGILANAEVALEDLDQDSPVRARAEAIKQAGDRASELTQQLLAYAGKADRSPETLDLGVLVGELAELLRTSLPGAAELRIELEEKTPWIHADATQLRQVVMNLITNAGDALDGRPGVITVRTGVALLDQGDLARCSLAEGVEAGEYAYVEVGDTGRGIEAEQLGQVFDPFFTTKFQGRGLGLAAVAGIIRGHRGAIRIESEPSSGTRFRVFLPRAAEAAAASAESTTAPGEWRGRGKALVVDDEEMVRSAAALLVERLGFNVLSASGGKEAVALLRENGREVAWVLLDVTMPGMDGEESFWALREVREDVPVIFMSGHSSQDIDSRLLGKSRVAKLRKPFRRADLERTIREVLEGA